MSGGAHSNLVTAMEACIYDILYVQQALIHEEQKQKVKTMTHCIRLGVNGRKISSFGAAMKLNFTAPSKDIQGHSTRQRLQKINLRAFAVSGDLSNIGKWLVDSGASNHITPQKTLFNVLRRRSTDNPSVYDTCPLCLQKVYDLECDQNVYHLISKPAGRV